METPQIFSLHHQEWKPHAEEETDPSFLEPVPKLSRLLSPRDAGRMSGIMASPVGLGLGLGPGSGQSVFTYSQLQELEHQALIFKYMVAGAPVPLHLVLPIWKSVVSSPVGGGFPPSSLSGGGLCFDFRNSMEPEPGRCRRTDGKKWRCSKEVVPDHKYCEKHIHRGRNRSRKPVERQSMVEPSKNVINSVATTNNNSISIGNNISDSGTHLSISISDGLLNNRPINMNSDGVMASVSSSQRLEFSPTTVLPKVYYGRSISDSSSGSTSRTESNLS